MNYKLMNLINSDVRISYMYINDGEKNLLNKYDTL